MPDDASLTYQPNGLVMFFAGLFFACAIYHQWMVLLIWDVWGEGRRGLYRELTSWLAPFLSVMLLHYAYIYWRHWRAIFSVTEEGIRDARITKSVVPWTEIESLSLKKGFFVSGICVTLKPATSLGNFGAPGHMPFLMYGRKSSASSFVLASGLKRNPAGIANDINRYPNTPAPLIVKKL